MLNIETTQTTHSIEKGILHSRMNWERGIKRGSANAGQSVVRRARVLLNTGTRTGRKYPNLPNRSSAPGEMPRTQSGRLAQLMSSTSGNIDSFKVMNTAPYAKILSEGSFERNLSPRKSRQDPWLEFVIGQEEGNTENYLHDGVLKEIE